VLLLIHSLDDTDAMPLILADVVAGPMAGAQLAELGAEATIHMTRYTVVF